MTAPEAADATPKDQRSRLGLAGLRARAKDVMLGNAATRGFTGELETSYATIHAPHRDTKADAVASYHKSLHAFCGDTAEVPSTRVELFNLHNTLQFDSHGAALRDQEDHGIVHGTRPLPPPISPVRVRQRERLRYPGKITSPTAACVDPGLTLLPVRSGRTSPTRRPANRDTSRDGSRMGPRDGSYTGKWGGSSGGSASRERRLKERCPRGPLLGPILQHALSGASAAPLQTLEDCGVWEFPEVLDDEYTFSGSVDDGSLAIVPIGGTVDLRRGNHSAVACGHSGHDVVVFGGRRLPAVLLNDVHVLEMGVVRWKHPVCAGRAPAARHSHVAAAAGPAGTTMLVHGGMGHGGAFLGDMFALDTVKWAWSEVWQPTAAHVPKPGPRHSHACAVVDGALFVFGGMTLRDTQPFDSELWIFNPGARAGAGVGTEGVEGGGGVDGASPAAAAKKARGGAKKRSPKKEQQQGKEGGAGAGDPAAGRGPRSKPAGWSVSGPNNDPPPRFNHAMASSGRCVTVAGGQRDTGKVPVHYLDVHVYNVDSELWTAVVSTTLISPPMLEGHSLCDVHGVMLMVGGRRAAVLEGDGGPRSLYTRAHSLAGLPHAPSWATFQQRSKAEMPSPRYAHTATCAWGRMVVFGGFTGDGFAPGLDDVSLLSMETAADAAENAAEKEKETLLWEAQERHTKRQMQISHLVHVDQSDGVYAQALERQRMQAEEDYMIDFLSFYVEKPDVPDPPVPEINLLKAKATSVCVSWKRIPVLEHCGKQYYGGITYLLYMSKKPAEAYMNKGLASLQGTILAYPETDFDIVYAGDGGGNSHVCSYVVSNMVKQADLEADHDLTERRVFVLQYFNPEHGWVTHDKVRQQVTWMSPFGDMHIYASQVRPSELEYLGRTSPMHRIKKDKDKDKDKDKPADGFDV